ncbi:hypothetical protein [Alkalicoccobacillus gibsonii]|uniref:hypothetical protein n=1 Tax=Alkalicoccobacillus gibsonii TaxID=79881 RepID=UPI0035193A85
MESSSGNQTKVVILGVGHANQLVSEVCQPAAYRAFFDRVQPDVIGIEREPSAFLRADFYEFTHEQQHIILPYAKKNDIPVQPFDWNASMEEQQLAWGVADSEQLPFNRTHSAFKPFLSFPEPFTYENDFFFSEKQEAVDLINGMLKSKVGEADFPRRFFLYRTYMQAMRIKHIAQSAQGKTVLIVVGHLHKPDIEQILKTNEMIELIPPSTYGYPSAAEIESHFELKDASFFMAFNLLGIQSQFNVERNWLKNVLEKVPSEHLFEKRLYQIRFQQLLEVNKQTDVIREYKELAEEIGWEERFLFQSFGRMNDRIDSYYDPFGNVSIKARIYIELARVFAKQGAYSKVEEMKAHILDCTGWSLEEKLRLEGYWEEYVLSMR